MYLRTTVQLLLAAMFMSTGFNSSPAQASSRHHYHHHHRQQHVSVNKHHERLAIRRGMHNAHRMRREPNSIIGLGSVHGQLAAKAHEIVASCGSSIISGFRPGAHIAGSGRLSLHASGRAVDIRGNPHCIYSHLLGWPGGYSVDYGSVQHVHISLGGREDGVRFSHYGGSHHHRRYG
jgi:hypothetical protein